MRAAAPPRPVLAASPRQRGGWLGDAGRDGPGARDAVRRGAVEGGPGPGDRTGRGSPRAGLEEAGLGQEARDEGRARKLARKAA